MTEDDRYQIAVLAEAAHLARQRYECHQMMNVHGDPEKARAQAIAYAIAKTEFMQAEHELRTAQSAIATR